MKLPLYDERRGAFARLKNRRVLMYWPHGFGDFVHFSFVVPLLEPSNTYFLTRFGDDFVHLYDEGEGVRPLYSGADRISDGSAYDARHLGVDFRRIRNRETELTIPEPLRSRLVEARIDTVLYTDYPEYEGKCAFPYHTKARALARALVTPERLAATAFSDPLRSSLRFVAPQPVRAQIEARLRTFVGQGEHLYVVAPGGHTNAKKTWAEEEVTVFVRALRMRDPRARVIAIDERSSAEIGREATLAPTTTDLFGNGGWAFAHVLVTLLRASTAFIGVAAGPLHAALAIGGRPIVGLWLAHHPDWYDEPCDDAIHILGPQISAQSLDRRPATMSKPLAFAARTVTSTQSVPSADDILATLDRLT